MNLVQFTEKPDSKAKLNEELPKIVQVNWNLGQQMVLSPRRLGQNEPFSPFHRYVNLVQFTEKPDSESQLNEELAKIVQETGLLEKKGPKSKKGSSTKTSTKSSKSSKGKKSSSPEEETEEDNKKEEFVVGELIFRTIWIHS